ncbi:hypothetical protein BpHYR1_043318 [Brachionus plicatilis]|uniref:Uncharacterized protein n=1 Tax=Brachionus plicatilis TaxID=10195 RepID=A0A3M7QHI2_BRAPC|nr:hypothetical protein BpHYR1_043318 [Brachionus plicatilis]
MEERVMNLKRKKNFDYLGLVDSSNLHKALERRRRRIIVVAVVVLAAKPNMWSVWAHHRHVATLWTIARQYGTVLDGANNVEIKTQTLIVQADTDRPQNLARKLLKNGSFIDVIIAKTLFKLALHIIT